MNYYKQQNSYNNTNKLQNLIKKEFHTLFSNKSQNNITKETYKTSLSNNNKKIKTYIDTNFKKFHSEIIKHNKSQIEINYNFQKELKKIQDNLEQQQIYNIKQTKKICALEKKIENIYEKLEQIVKDIDLLRSHIYILRDNYKSLKKYIIELNLRVSQIERNVFNNNNILVSAFSN